MERRENNDVDWRLSLREGPICVRNRGSPPRACHCTDCRRHAGAPLVGWALVPKDALNVEGEVRTYASSEHGRREFCPSCGTGLFYRNEAIFPDHVDVQSCTLDDPGALQPEAQIQVAERIGWMERLDQLPEFDRYPGP